MSGKSLGREECGVRAAEPGWVGPRLRCLKGKALPLPLCPPPPSPSSPFPPPLLLLLSDKSSSPQQTHIRPAVGRREERPCEDSLRHSAWWPSFPFTLSIQESLGTQCCSFSRFPPLRSPPSFPDGEHSFFFSAASRGWKAQKMAAAFHVRRT